MLVKTEMSVLVLPLEHRYLETHYSIYSSKQFSEGWCLSERCVVKVIYGFSARENKYIGMDLTGPFWGGATTCTSKGASISEVIGASSFFFKEPAPGFEPRIFTPEPLKLNKRSRVWNRTRSFFKNWFTFNYFFFWPFSRSWVFKRTFYDFPWKIWKILFGK